MTSSSYDVILPPQLMHIYILHTILEYGCTNFTAEFAMEIALFYVLNWSILREF